MFNVLNTDLYGCILPYLPTKEQYSLITTFRMGELVIPSCITFKQYYLHFQPDSVRFQQSHLIYRINDYIEFNYDSFIFLARKVLSHSNATMLDYHVMTELYNRLIEVKLPMNLKILEYKFACCFSPLTLPPGLKELHCEYIDGGCSINKQYYTDAVKIYKRPGLLIYMDNKYID